MKISDFLPYTPLDYTLNFMCIRHYQSTTFGRESSINLVYRVLCTKYESARENIIQVK